MKTLITTLVCAGALVASLALGRASAAPGGIAGRAPAACCGGPKGNVKLHIQAKGDTKPMKVSLSPGTIGYVVGVVVETDAETGGFTLDKDGDEGTYFYARLFSPSAMGTWMGGSIRFEKSITLNPEKGHFGVYYVEVPKDA